MAAVCIPLSTIRCSVVRADTADMTPWLPQVRDTIRLAPATRGQTTEEAFRDSLVDGGRVDSVVLEVSVVAHQIRLEALEAATSSEHSLHKADHGRWI